MVDKSISIAWKNRKTKRAATSTHKPKTIIRIGHSLYLTITCNSMPIAIKNSPIKTIAISNVFNVILIGFNNLYIG